MARHHLVISGTGRAGTTFLVALLGELGLDIGFAEPGRWIDEVSHSGLEWDIRHPGAPYVVKSPWMCDYLDETLAAGEIVVDHALVPLRDLHAAAESRRDVMRRSPGPIPGVGVPGGLWHSEDPAAQETVLARKLYELVRALARHDVPTTLLDFPRLVRDARYLHRKLAPLLPDSSYERFAAAFEAIARPALVHDFPPPRA